MPHAATCEHGADCVRLACHLDDARPTAAAAVAAINETLTRPRFHSHCGETHVPGPCNDGVTRPPPPLTPEECVRLLGEHCWVGTGVVWPEGGRPERCKHCTATRSAFPNPTFSYVYPEGQP